MLVLVCRVLFQIVEGASWVIFNRKNKNTEDEVDSKRLR